jgi:hypothetical protein
MPTLLLEVPTLMNVTAPLGYQAAFSLLGVWSADGSGFDR